MNDKRKSPPEVIRDDPMIAAEWSLGLLEGEELIAARSKQQSDADFAWRKEWWDNWFAPLADEIALAEPSPQVWEEITARLDAPGKVAALAKVQPRIRHANTGRWIAAITAAAAALAAIFTFIVPQQQGTAPLTQPAALPVPLVAAVAIGDTGLSLDVTYQPQEGSLLVAAEGLAADGLHDHELWLVPPDGGALASLGVIAPGEVRRHRIPDDVGGNLRAGARLLLTREPLGGKPAGSNAGPVVAEGDFTPVA